MSDPAAIDAFISRWENSGAAERANYQLALDVLRPARTLYPKSGNARVLECAGNDTALGTDPPSPATPESSAALPRQSPNQNSTIINLSSVASAKEDRQSSPSSSSLHPSSLNLHPFPLADRLAHSGPDADSLSQSLLSRLVALNHERAAEEKRGHIRGSARNTRIRNPPAPTLQKSKIKTQQSSILPPTKRPSISLRLHLLHPSSARLGVR